MENFQNTTPSTSNCSAISVGSKRLSIFSRIHNSTLDKTENSGNQNQRVNLRHSSVTSSDFGQLEGHTANAVASGRGPDSPAVGIPPPSSSSCAGQCPGGTTGNGGGARGGNSVMKLLDDLHHSRIRIEQDQREYQKVRGEIGELDKKINMLELETEKSNQKWNSVTDTVAGHKTQLKSIEIKNKVYDGTLKSLAEELASSQQELHQLRMSALQVSSTFLLESIDFATTWNGSELGHNNRIKFQQEGLEELLREHRQLEYELVDFLEIRKGLEELQADVDDLEREYKEFDDIKTKKEKEVQERIDEYDMTLKDLEKENEELVRSSEAEYEKLKGELEEHQEAVKTLETTSNNTKVMIQTQQASTKTATAHQQDSEEQDENNSSMINSINDSSSNQQFDNSRQSKPNLSRFQVPIKAQIPNSSRPQASVQTFNNGKDDEDFVETSRSNFANNVRTYDPMTPSTSYTSNYPPCKVRIVERQTPITSFMRQLSSNMKRPPKKKSTSTRENIVVPVQAPIPKGKIFNFKKKTPTTSTLQNESYNTSSDSLNSPSFANSSMEPTYAEESNDSDKSFAYSTLDDRPFSCFNPSRVLLSEKQQLLLLTK